MKNSDTGVYKDLFAEYESVKIFFLTAIFLVVGINLISSYISNYLVGSEQNSIKLVIIGFFLCTPSILYFIKNILNKRKKYRIYEAFIIYDIQKNEIIPVQRYKFSEEIWDYINGAFVENPAFKEIWDRKPLKERVFSKSDKGINHKQTAAQLLIEAAECFLLFNLSTCLEDYFNDKKFNGEKIKLFNRENISDIVLSNRLLDLISKPMEERPYFKDEINEDGVESEGRTIAFYSFLGGPQYHEFSLYLPIGSNVSRSEDNTIEIKSKDLDILMSVQFEGSGTLPPQGFIENCLGIDDWLLSVDICKLKIYIQLGIKLRLLFSRKAWKDYHSWVDLYIDGLERDVSWEAYFDFIGWETTHTLIQCIKNKASS